jgi:hypothetical protein
METHAHKIICTFGANLNQDLFLTLAAEIKHEICINKRGWGLPLSSGAVFTAIRNSQTHSAVRQTN